MPTRIQLVNAALAEIKQASWTPQQWAHAIQLGYNGQPYNYAITHNFKAQQLLWQATRPGAELDPPPNAFESLALQNAYIEMKAAYWSPDQWCKAIRDGYKGQPYKYTLTRNWKAQVDLFDARAGHLPPPPPPPPPAPDWTPDPLLQNVSVGAFSPWDAGQWPNCNILISADPSLDRFVQRSIADAARANGHTVNVWYVPDQVDHARALHVCDVLGSDPHDLVADCETLVRWQIAFHSGVTKGIYNLSAIVGNAEAERAISSRAFKGMNEFYWNQSRRRQPDNHNLPVDSIQIAVYNGCSDSGEPDCWEPHVQQYRDAGYFWPSVGAYQQNMTATDWALMPPVHK